MKKLNNRGEGMIQNILFLAVFAGLAYAGYVYLWPKTSSTPAPTSQTAASPTGDQKAGSMAGAAVQGAAAAGEVYGSGR